MLCRGVWSSAADETHQQKKTTPGDTSVNYKQETEATVHMSSLIRQSKAGKRNW